tara:strand:+ start:131 stop:565 length:435 start_codon:yes stop_codon:yes gene_type:complete
MKLYSFKGNFPDVLPDRIRLSNGETKTDKSNFTDSDLADAGYILAPDKPDVSSYDFHVLNWSSDSDKWLLRTEPTDAEKNREMAVVRNQRDELLKEADIISLRSLENGIIDPHIKKYKQALRDIPTTIKTPFGRIEWPVYGDSA